MKIVDSHLHLDIIHDDAIFNYIRQHLCGIVIWSFCDARPATFADLTAYFDQQKAFADACSAKGLSCYRLAGIHPRNLPTTEIITQAKVDALLAAQRPTAQGLGELGLEKGTEAEKTVLAMQLDFARRHDLKACIHTPRQNKTEMLAHTLEIVAASGIAPAHVVVDHLADAAMVSTVLAAGLHAGITIAPVKSHLADVLQILAAHESHLEWIMLNSDLAQPKLEDYVMYIDTVKALPAKYAITSGQTALNFLGIPD